MVDAGRLLRGQQAGADLERLQQEDVDLLGEGEAEQEAGHQRDGAGDQPLPKLGPWSSDLDRLLEINAGKARRERLTLIRMFEELQGLGYRGGYDAVRRYAAGWLREHSLAKVPALLVVGKKEAESRSVSIRRFGSDGQSVRPLDEALRSLVEEALPPDLKRLA